MDHGLLVPDLVPRPTDRFYLQQLVDWYTDLRKEPLDAFEIYQKNKSTEVLKSGEDGIQIEPKEGYVAIWLGVKGQEGMATLNHKTDALGQKAEDRHGPPSFSRQRLRMAQPENAWTCWREIPQLVRLFATTVAKSSHEEVILYRQLCIAADAIAKAQGSR